MRYVGKISKVNYYGNTYYNFEAKAYIDDRGKINRASESQVLDDIRGCHPDWNYDQIDRRDRNKITIWVWNNVGNAVLDELSDGQKLIWDLDLNQNVELRRDQRGFTTVEDYTVETDFESIDSVFPVIREDYETVTGELNRKLTESKNSIDQWIENRFGVRNLTDYNGEDTDTVVEALNALFPDFNNPNYGEIYGDRDRTSAYLLKYGFAYTYLYKSLYNKIFELMDDDEKADVLSIGCGAKIDMAGLKLALLETNREKAAYYGIDLNDWTDNNNTNFCMFPDQGCFDAVNIVDFLERENDTYNSINSNIIIFPYSMSELVDAGVPWESVLNNLPGRLTSDKIYIAANIRSGGNEETDRRSFSELIARMTRAGYQQEGATIEVRGIDGTIYINETDDGGRLSETLNIGRTGDGTETVAGYLKSIKEYNNDIKCNAILGTKYIRYNIAKFTRGNEA